MVVSHRQLEWNSLICSLQLLSVQYLFLGSHLLVIIPFLLKRFSFFASLQQSFGGVWRFLRTKLQLLPLNIHCRCILFFPYKNIF